MRNWTPCLFARSPSRKNAAGGPLEIARCETVRLLPLVRLDFLLNFPLHCVEVKRSWSLHRWVVDRRFGELCDILLHHNKTPELSGIEVLAITKGARVW